MASSSGMLFAYISSEASMRLTLPNICFSPVDRPFSASRRARLRTTSASSSGIPGPDLLAVVLDPPVPVERHLGGVVAQHAHAPLPP